MGKIRVVVGTTASTEESVQVSVGAGVGLLAVGGLAVVAVRSRGAA